LPVEREDPEILDLRRRRAIALRVVRARHHALDLCDVALQRLRKSPGDLESSIRSFENEAEQCRIQLARAEADLAELQETLAARGRPSLAVQADPIAIVDDDDPDRTLRTSVQQTIAALDALASAQATLRARLVDVF
jgi:uncharacterized protein YigA (DUF484 family)